MKARIIFPAVIAILVAAAQGCIWRRGAGVEIPPFPTREGDSKTPASASRGTTEGFGLKTVAGKEEPNRLIARDGTVCTVSKRKFQSVVLGKTTWCGWMDQKR